MDLDELSKLIKQSTIYFPPVAWAYYLDKTNSFVGFIALVATTIFSVIYNSHIKKLASKVNVKKAKTIYKKSGYDGVLDEVIKETFPDVMPNLFYEFLFLVVGIILLILSFLALWTIKDNLFALYLLIIGISAFILGAIKYLRNLFRYVSMWVRLWLK